MLLVAVIGFVGQSDAGLGEVHQIPGRVLGVGIDIHADAAAHPGALQGADGRGQRVGVGSVIDRGEFVEQRLHASALDGFLIEETGIEVTDTLFVGFRGGARVTGFDNQVAHLLFGAVEKVRKAPSVARSAGISYSASQRPLTWPNRSSWGRASVST